MATRRMTLSAAPCAKRGEGALLVEAVLRRYRRLYLGVAIGVEGSGVVDHPIVRRLEQAVLNRTAVASVDRRCLAA
jgi:hypothetical protein